MNILPKKQQVDNLFESKKLSEKSNSGDYISRTKEMRQLFKALQFDKLKKITKHN